MSLYHQTEHKLQHERSTVTSLRHVEEENVQYQHQICEMAETQAQMEGDIEHKQQVIGALVVQRNFLQTQTSKCIYVVTESFSIDAKIKTYL